MNRASYDAIAERFHAIRIGFRPKETVYLSLLLDPVKTGGKVLDLGCGTGQPIASHIAELGHHITGIDGSEAMLAIARERMPEQRWIHGQMEDFELDETFDAVVCWDSLFHMPRQFYQPIIRKIHRWLVPGGRLMVSSGIMVDDTPEGFTDTMFGHEFYYDSLSPEQMVAVIEQTGFKVLLAEMCNIPDGGRDKGKWATVAEKLA
ncbi:MAG: class I SAM-dependent methyltransferase [Luteolibacter sp.]|uniref:class I SAM-dependent methyltransferase n=1 Tax=Luteolibacter sp. TaxID=1962973 RepID=UPI00326329C1